MPIDDKWRKLIPEQIHNAPDFPGVFEFADILQEHVLYIGHTKSLAQTLLEIFEKKPPEFNTVSFFRFHATNDHQTEYNELLADYKTAHNTLPQVNKLLADTSD
jgi:excinuclease UvrABC nuclease subunit